MYISNGIKQIVQLSLPPMLQALNHKVFGVVKEVASETGVKAYVVGGYVRDIFLNRISKDVDFTVIGDGIDFATQVAHKLGESANVNVFKNFGTAMIASGDWDIEFVGARKESYQSESRKPIVTTGSFEDDLSRRDFTINALAISMNEADFGQLIDLYHGMEDLKSGIIKTPLAPGITFSDDPLRMMRAIRFATQLNFALHPETFQGIKENASRISIVSMERISDELNKIILSPKPSIGFKHLLDTGLLELIFPEMQLLLGVDTINGLSHKDNFYHTIQVLDNLCEESDDLWLRWSAILHDIAKPQTKRFVPGEGWTFHGHEDKGSRMVKGIFKRLKLPLNEKLKFVEKMVLLHLRPIVLSQEVVTDSAVRRLIFDAGEDIDSLMKLCRADITTKSEFKVRKFLNNLKVVADKIKDVEERDRVRNWQPPIDGLQIMEIFGIQAGREIGILKNALREAILDGEIKNDYDEALSFLITEGDKIGLKAVKI
jgi:poly(A) polymerase